MLTIRKQQLLILEDDMRRRLGLTVVAELKNSAPHAINGLSKKEIDIRRDIGVRKTGIYQLENSEDVKTFVRLCFLVGLNFDEYPPFHEILTSDTSKTGLPILDLFCNVEKDDWNKAAQFDILSRSKEPIPENETEGINSQSAASKGMQLSLAHLQDKHAAAYHINSLHPDVWRLARMKPMTTIEVVQDFIADLKFRDVTGYVILGDKNQFLGTTTITPLYGTNWISYWISRGMWGQGIATKVLNELIRFFRQRDISRIGLKIEPGNIPSIRVAEKCGFKIKNDLSDTRLIFEL